MERTKELLDQIMVKQKELLVLIDEFEGVSTIGICGVRNYKRIQLRYSQDLLTLAKIYKKQITNSPCNGQDFFNIDGTIIFA